MPAPLDFIANTLLTFLVPDGSFAEDPVTGNLIPGSRSVEVRAFLKKKARQQDGGGGGLSDTRSYWEGYTTDPAILPDTIAAPCVVDAVLDGRTGSFSLLSVYRVAAIQELGLTDVTGTPIQGWFEQIGGRP